MRDVRRVGGRGQSEVLGLVVIFAIVITAIALVAATGFAGLQDARHIEEANNGVRAFEILDDNIDDLVLGRAPDRATEIKLSNTQIGISDPITIEVRGHQVGNSSANFTHTYEVDPIEYDVGEGTRLIYAGGALIREEYTGEVMLREPTVVRSGRVAILPIVQTRGIGPTSMGGSRTVNVRTHLSETSLLVAETVPHQVEMRVTSPQTAAWSQYFSNGPCEGDEGVRVADGDTVICDLGVVDRTYVSVVRIDVEFE